MEVTVISLKSRMVYLQEKNPVFYFESEDDCNPSRPGISTMSAAEPWRLSPQPIHYTEDNSQLTQWRSPSWETSFKRVRNSPKFLSEMGPFHFLVLFF